LAKGIFPQVDFEFDKLLESKNVPPGQRWRYKKVVMFYLDFCGRRVANIVPQASSLRFFSSWKLEVL